MTNPKETKPNPRQRFDEFASGYVTSKTHAGGPELNRLVDIAQPRIDWVVLDVATGGGHTALKFAPHVGRVLAADIAPKMLRSAQAFIAESGVTNVIFGLADAQNLAFKEGAFDLVVCRIAPHHFPDCFRFVRESSRVLKPGGILLVQDHVLPEEEDAARFIETFEKKRDPGHHSAFTEKMWIKMFMSAGLNVEYSEQISKVHNFWSWAQRQGCSLETIEALVNMVQEATNAVVEWMQPRGIGTPEATFTNRHIIILGRKST